MNRALRRALADANVTDADVATRLEVGPEDHPACFSPTTRAFAPY